MGSGRSSKKEHPISISSFLKNTFDACYSLLSSLVPRALLRPKHNTQLRMLPLEAVLTRKVSITPNLPLSTRIASFQLPRFPFVLQKLVDNRAVVSLRLDLRLLMGMVVH